MFVPSFVIVLPCIASFLLSGACYYLLDPPNRVLERHFLASSGSILTMIVYVMARQLWPQFGLLPVVFLLLALALLGYSTWLFRRMRNPSVEKIPG
jgi:predicted PurR-regulated permease PerM